MFYNLFLKITLQGMQYVLCEVIPLINTFDIYVFTGHHVFLPFP